MAEVTSKEWREAARLAIAMAETGEGEVSPDTGTFTFTR